jgi:tetratricopeptide (TPR) repeat protein
LQKIYIYFLLKIHILLFVLTSYIWALNPHQESLKSTILKGIELTINNQFDEALLLYQQVINKYPQHPIGYFYQGATLQAKIFDSEDYNDLEQFFKSMELAILKADSLHKAGLSDPWIRFYEGSAYLYRGFMKTKVDGWFSAYRDAKKGVNRLEKALVQDSLLYDAYLGIGSFKYWKSARANFLLWLPFISDEREKGIRMVNHAIENGEFVHSVGKDQLCWIFMDKGDFGKALEIARQNHSDYPLSRFFKWTLAFASFGAEKLDLSFRLYGELLGEVRKLPSNNHFNEVECLVKMAEISIKLQNWDKAVELADQALSLPLTEELHKRAKNKLKKAAELKHYVTVHTEN